MAESPMFYVTGGTIPVTSRSYVERQADRELLSGLQASEFCYVLTSRQMGKSSLMVRTATKLRNGGIAVAVLDLTAIGQNVSPDQWYDGLAQRLGRQLDLEDELDDFAAQHPKLGPAQRFFASIRDAVLPRCSGKLVIFVDEIDAVRSLPFSTDEFFAAIRECYNRRPEDPEFRRVTFCLLGVATPADLIRDTRTTPFNIGKRILLTDFTSAEASPLSQGLITTHDGRPDITNAEATDMLSRVLHWTNGQPFLTQRFCRSIREHNDRATDGKSRIRTAEQVDVLCHEMFLSHKSRETDDNLAFVRGRLLNVSEIDRAALLDLYRKVRKGRRIPDDETNPLINTLRLSGIVRGHNGRMVLRNRIYETVFDDKWILNNLPEAEKLRQKRAERKGALRGLAIAAAFALVGVIVWYQSDEIRRETKRTLERITQCYRNLNTYSEIVEVKTKVTERPEGGAESGQEFSGTVKADTRLRSSGEFAANVTFRSGPIQGAYQAIRNDRHSVIRNGTNVLYSGQKSLVDFISDQAFADEDGLLAGFYHFILARDIDDAASKMFQDAKWKERGDISGESADVIEWRLPLRTPKDHGKAATGISNSPVRPVFIPAKGWFSHKTGALRRLELDFSQVLNSYKLVLPSQNGLPDQREYREIKVSEYKVTSTHREVRINQPIDGKVFEIGPFRSRQPSGPWSRALALIIPNERPAPITREKARREIPPRSPDVPLHLIDLSPNFNANLKTPWHSDRNGNDLSELPTGLQTLGGVPFDVRGVLQLSGTAEPHLARVFPSEERIAVGMKCKKLHFLQGAGWDSQSGRPIATYVIRYDDGESRAVAVIFGYDVYNWVPAGLERKHRRHGVRVAWEGRNEAFEDVELYLQTWDNPRPEVPVKYIDFISAQAPSAPFLLAITADP